VDGTTVIKNATATSFEEIYRAVSVSSELESTNAAFSFKTSLLLKNQAVHHQKAAGKFNYTAHHQKPRANNFSKPRTFKSREQPSRASSKAAGRNISNQAAHLQKPWATSSKPRTINQSLQPRANKYLL